MDAYLFDPFQMKQSIDLALVPNFCALVEVVPFIDVASPQRCQVVFQCILGGIVSPYRSDGGLALRVDVRTVVSLFTRRLEFEGWVRRPDAHLDGVYYAREYSR